MKKKLLDLEQYLVGLSVKKLLILFFFVILIKIGFWYHPALWKLLTISINPFDENIYSNPYAHYLYYNFLGGYLANLLNITSKLTFFLFHLLFSFLFVFSFVFLIFKNLSRRDAIYSLIIFLILPVSTTVFYWVGYDSITLSIFILSILFRSYLIIVLLCGTLLGLQHFELGFLSSLSLLSLNIYNKYTSKKSFLSLRYSVFLFIGTILGKFLLEYYFAIIELNLTSGRTWHTLDVIKHFLYNGYFNFYNIIWFSLSLGWLIILRYSFFKERNIFFIIILLGQLLILFVVDDQTRVYANLSFLIILSQILLNKDFLAQIKNYEISLIIIIWLIMPYGWVWQGVLRTSMFTYDFAYLLNYFFDIFNNESINSSKIWPFKILR
jgi:hypothetical protein